MGNSNCDAIDALGGIINSTGNGDVAGVLGSLADACRIGEDNRRDRYDHDRERYDRRQEYYREQHEYRQYQQEEVNDIIRRVQDMYPEELERAVSNCRRFEQGSFYGQILDSRYDHLTTGQVNTVACREVDAEVRYRRGR